MTIELFDPVGEITRDRDLDGHARVNPLAPRLRCDGNRLGKPGHQGLPVRFHFRGEYEHSGRLAAVKFILWYRGNRHEKRRIGCQVLRFFVIMDLFDHGRQAGLAHLPERERGARAEDLIGI